MEVKKRARVFPKKIWELISTNVIVQYLPELCPRHLNGLLVIATLPRPAISVSL